MNVKFGLNMDSTDDEKSNVSSTMNVTKSNHSKLIELLLNRQTSERSYSTIDQFAATNTIVQDAINKAMAKNNRTE